MPPSPVDHFRKAQQQSSERTPPSSFDPWGMEIFQIAIGERAVIRVLDPGATGFFVDTYHWLGRRHACSLHLPDFDSKCVFCYRWDKADRGSQEKNNLYPRTQYCIEVIDFRYFHKTKTGDKTELVVCASSEHLPGRVRCHHCNNVGVNTSERFFGGHKVWELGKEHFNQLVAVHDIIATTCIAEVEGGGICGKEVYEVGYVCVKCGHEFISEADLHKKPPEELANIADNKQVCPKCGNEDMPLCQKICSSEDHEAVPASLFDKNLEVTKAGEVKVNQRTGKERKSSSLNFDRGAPFSNVVEDIMKHGFSHDEALKMCEPWNLVERYRPERLDPAKFESKLAYVNATLVAQAKELKIENPYPSSYPTEDRSRPFGASRFRR